MKKKNAQTQRLFAPPRLLENSEDVVVAKKNKISMFLPALV